MPVENFLGEDVWHGAPGGRYATYKIWLKRLAQHVDCRRKIAQ